MFETERKKALLVHPELHLPGGSSGVCVWMIQCLKQKYDLAILCGRDIDWDYIDRAYGTNLADSEIQVVRPEFLGRLIDAFPTGLFLLKSSILMRRCRRMARKFDLLISCDNEVDFGRGGIQYIHYPRYAFPRPQKELRWFHRIPGGLAGYYLLCKFISGYSDEGMRRNKTLANSSWTARLVRQTHKGLECEVLRPPVRDDFPDTDWNLRENGFVCVGRIAPEKELEKVIRILETVRQNGCKTHLHIAGHLEDPAYFRSLSAYIRPRSSWVFLEHSLSRKKLARLIASHKYGIHGMIDEHYGLAVAEMAMAGCIVFAPDSGGQREILGNRKNLLYSSPRDAADKIRKTMIQSETQQRKLRALLGQKRGILSIKAFCRRLEKILEASI